MSAENEQVLTYSVDEAAKQLRVSSLTVRTAIKRDGLPAMRIGRRILIPVAALNTWLANRTEAGVDAQS